VPRGSIYPAYLSLKKPLIVDAQGKFHDSIQRPRGMSGEGAADAMEIAAFARNAGYDGVIIRDVREPSGHGDNYIAFSPEQIKSVHNRGTFDPGDPRILHQQKAKTPRGAIRQLDDGRYIVGLFKNRDASTVIHESGHFFLENLREAAGLETAPQWVRDSWATLQKSYGFDDTAQGEAWRGAQERFAREFEAYAREGKAPSPELRGAFEQFKTWLTEIYKSVKKLLGGDELRPEVRDVFDNLLRTDQEAAARPAEPAEPRAPERKYIPDDPFADWEPSDVLHSTDSTTAIPLDPNKPALPQGELRAKDASKIRCAR